jgi:diguanylate cyclase (GGDEF)-like protein
VQHPRASGVDEQDVEAPVSAPVAAATTLPRPRVRLPRPSGALVGVIAAAGILLGWLAPGLVGRNDTLVRCWLVLPAVVAGARFGVVGAVSASMAATVMSGPFGDVVPGGARTGQAVWLSTLLFFVAVSGLVALLVSRIHAADERVVTLLEEQREQAVLAAEEKGRLSRELERRVNTDVVTGLANRTAFVETLRHRLVQGRPLAVLFVDLDDFKKVNDTLGHTVGDELIVNVAERLRRGTRESDIVARFGGDEFAVMLWDLNADDALQVAQRMLGQLKTPFHLCGRTVSVRASGGLAVSAVPPANVEDRVVELMRQADLAMYASKSERTHGITLFHDGMQSEMMDRLSLESDLHRALGSDDLSLHYQPIVDLQADTVVGVEALLRWQHPTRGAIPPASFIPVAEQTGLIVPMTLWVVRQACQQLAVWDDSPATRDLAVAINISGRLVVEPGIGSAIARELFHAGIDPHRVVLEITESLLMEDRPQAVQTLCQLRALGMRLSVDDFGTGYSSLSRLNTLPIDEVKIDKSFIDRLALGGAGDTIVRASVAMAHGLGLRVVAEGVETTRQLDALRAVGCDEAQGYLFSRPVPSDELSPLLEQARADNAIVRRLPVQRTPEQVTQVTPLDEALTS